MTSQQKKSAKRWTRIAAIAGMLLGIACQLVPPEYKVVCNLAAQIVPHTCNP